VVVIALDHFSKIDSHIVLGVFGIWIAIRDDPALVSIQKGILIHKVSISSNVASEDCFGIISFWIPDNTFGQLPSFSLPKAWTALRAAAAMAT